MPQDPESMYRWRRVDEAKRAAILKERLSKGHPIHSPYHVESDRTSYYLLTAACYEHAPHIGFSVARMQQFSEGLCKVAHDTCRSIFAWVVLPNHYHVLVDTPRVELTLRQLGQHHGRSSFEWNGVEATRGRRVWCNAAETAMKSEGHFYASINYVLNNPVHHGYCKKWSDWAFSSAVEYIEKLGRQKALRYWNAYPLLEYGMKWDPPEL